MLRFNSFRSDRYLRSKFLEGRYFLASEASDLELELIDSLRRIVQTTIGDVAVDSAFEVTRLSQTQLLIKPGEAWFKGLPFRMRSGGDQLVSGASLTLGIVPPGVTVTDDLNGGGKILTFTKTPDAPSTPTSLYRIIISAQEQIITDVEDPFIKNSNLTESTAQKIRLFYKIHIVTDGNQTETPSPYVNDNGTYQTSNLTNQIKITPALNLNGEVLSISPISGSVGIDGRDLELVIRNDSSLVGGIKIPNSSTDQQTFYNGKFIDSLGNKYHVNAIFNDTISTQVIVRLDKEYGQPNPVINIGQPYYLLKRDVYVTDDVNGNPVGKLFWPIAKVNWNVNNGFVHQSNITDLRNKVVSDATFETLVTQKFNCTLTGGGVIGVDIDGETVHWSSNFNLLSPTSAQQQIPANEVVLLDGGSIVYKLNFNGGIIALGNVNVSVDSIAGALIQLSGSPDLSAVKIGNTFKVGSESSFITSIDNVNKVITVADTITTTGAAKIYRDSFAANTLFLEDDLFVLAVRSGNEVVINDNLHLSPGTSNAIYDERVQFPSGLPFGTPIALPDNSRNGNKPQYYSASRGNLMVFQNQNIKFQGVDWLPNGNQEIIFSYDLPADTEIHFRMESLPSGSLGGGGPGGGGSGSLQDAYLSGSLITTNPSFPIVINGPVGEKLLEINGDIKVTGVIDPIALELIPQAHNPLNSYQKGIWLDNDNNLILTQSPLETINVTDKIKKIEAGDSVQAINKLYLNNSEVTIPQFTPVYSPVPGQIAIADGYDPEKSKVIGVTLEAIEPQNSGSIALYGVVKNIIGYNHNSILYLGSTPGSKTDIQPTLDNYEAGFNVVKLGVIEGSDLILQIAQVEVLKDDGFSTATTSGLSEAEIRVYTPAVNSFELLKVQVVGFEAATNSAVSFEKTLRVKNSNQVASIEDVQSDYTSQDPILNLTNCYFVAVDSSISIRVVGMIGKVINWNCLVQRFSSVQTSGNV